MIDFGFHNAASSLSTAGNGRIFSIDVKEDILVAGHDDGSVRLYSPDDCGGASLTLTVTNCPIVFIKILSSRETGGARLLCWSRAGDCYLVSPRPDINLIGRSGPV